jgi:hypothetical protein
VPEVRLDGVHILDLLLRRGEDVLGLRGGDVVHQLEYSIKKDSLTLLSRLKVVLCKRSESEKSLMIFFN